jgi:hypothetical protein
MSEDGSLARPGGYITGVFLDFPGFTAKWLELLKENNPESLPSGHSVGPSYRPDANEGIERAVGSLNIQLDISEVRAASDFDDAFASASSSIGVSARTLNTDCVRSGHPAAPLQSVFASWADAAH